MKITHPSLFAEIDKDGVVLRVLAVEQSFIDTGALGDPSNWVRTCKYTSKNVHRVINVEKAEKAKGLRNSWLPPEQDDINVHGHPLRGNYAAVGGRYDKDKDHFVPPQPFPSWSYSFEKGEWLAPKERPLLPYEDPEMYFDDAETGGRAIKSNKRPEVPIWKWDEDKQEWYNELERVRIEKIDEHNNAVPDEASMSFNFDLDDWVNDVTGKVEH
ncbi:MAG: hypothetical protein QGH83_10555, partial [Candidatus Pacebacteria bacterium]|nr:hypothetical protein [Candidatus Paceibacterota bacterium]